MSGGGWTTSKLSTILKNPIYVMADSRIYEYFQKLNMQIISSPESFDGIHGVQIYGKTKHEAGNNDWSDIKAVIMTHEGVVSSDTWIKCQQKLANNRQIRNAVSNKTSWLGGKIVCGRCARTMTTIKGKASGGEIRRYFICTGKTHFKDCKGTKSTIYADSLENMVYAEIAKRLENLNGVKSSERKKFISRTQRTQE
ncbi:MAG: recombinase family protein [Clostridiales bacterium]|nr:MAG: recombinase family protein [Clostridiales bacterium]